MSSKIGIALLLSVILACVLHFGFISGETTRPIAVPIDVVATAVPLNRKNPKMANIGRLRYVKGWVLTSDDPGFGGFSGLVVDQDQNGLTAISDRGDWFTALLDIGADAPVTNAKLIAYQDKQWVDIKNDLDTESVIRWGDDLLVSFEQRHKLELVNEPGGKARRFAWADNMDFSEMPENGGMEAIVRLSHGELLVFSERGRDKKGLCKAWLVTADSSESLLLKAPEHYAPTDAALLANGDVLLMLRHFVPSRGILIKLLQISANAIKPDAVLVGTEVAHLELPLNVDNMEGLDTVVLPDGSTRIFMISDDNFASDQRTLLLVFDLQGELL